MDENAPVGAPGEHLNEYIQDERTVKKPSKDTIITTVPGMGSIVYKRIESGEIVASIVRNADEDANNLTTLGAKNTVAPSLKKKIRAKIDDFLEDDREEIEAARRKKKKAQLAAEKSVNVCPINEKNVENILDRTLLVTESLQQLLNSFKEELKRAGGGPTFGRELKPAGLRKRVEIAEKMTKAYINYQQAIDDIGELGRGDEGGEDDEYDDEDYEDGADDDYDERFTKESDQNDFETEENLPVKPRNALGDKKRGPKTTEPPRNYPAPSRFPTGEDSSETWREEMVAAKENKYWDNFTSGGTNVSDDLWMSCEPGSDDESIYNVGFPKGNSKK